MNKQYKIYFHIMGCVRYGVVAGALRVFLPAADVASGPYCIALCGIKKKYYAGVLLHSW